MRPEHDIPIIALDGLPLQRALFIARKLGQRTFALKVHDLYDREGPDVVWRLMEAGARRVFVDFKLDDTWLTVGLRAQALAASGADILTVHCSCGIESLRQARLKFPQIVSGVTVLTSIDENTGEEIYKDPILMTVEKYARWARTAGLKSLVCSAQEVGRLSSQRLFRRFRFIVPGTRLPGSSKKNRRGQARIDTPANAIRHGATHLVWGRDVAHAGDIVRAFEAHMANVRTALPKA